MLSVIRPTLYRGRTEGAQSGLDPLCTHMNWTIVAWGTSTLLGTVGAVLALTQARQSYNQRKREYRWRQVEMGKTLVDEMFKAPDAYEGALMLDGMFENRELPDGKRESIDFSGVVQAIQSARNPKSEKHRYILRCLDEFFYHIDRFEYFIQLDLVTFPDIAIPAEYYAGLLAGAKTDFMDYLKLIGYVRALAFLNRFPAWH